MPTIISKLVRRGKNQTKTEVRWGKSVICAFYSFNFFTICSPCQTNKGVALPDSCKIASM